MKYVDVDINQFQGKAKETIGQFIKNVQADPSFNTFEKEINQLYKTLEENNVNQAVIFRIEHELGF